MLKNAYKKISRRNTNCTRLIDNGSPPQNFIAQGSQIDSVYRFSIGINWAVLFLVVNLDNPLCINKIFFHVMLLKITVIDQMLVFGMAVRSYLLNRVHSFLFRVYEGRH